MAVFVGKYVCIQVNGQVYGSINSNQENKTALSRGRICVKIMSKYNKYIEFLNE